MHQLMKPIEVSAAVHCALSCPSCQVVQPDAGTVSCVSSLSQTSCSGPRCVLQKADFHGGPKLGPPTLPPPSPRVFEQQYLKAL